MKAIAAILLALTIAGCSSPQCDRNTGLIFHNTDDRQSFWVSDSTSATQGRMISRERYIALQSVLNDNCRVRLAIEEEIERLTKP